MSSKELLGVLSITMSLFAYASYFRSIFQRQTKPHMFTWIVWMLTGSIGFLGQYLSGAGAGSWSTCTTAIICACVAGVSFFLGEKNITKSDWVFFIAALSGIPLWYFTKDPLGAVLLVSFINVAGAYPTLRKSYVTPYGENILSWSLHMGRTIFTLLAIEHYSLVTTIFPSVVLGVNISILSILVWRRYAVKA